MDWKLLPIAVLVGFVPGIIVGAKYVNTPDSRIVFRKIKVKGEGNTALPDMKLPEAEKKQKKKLSIKKIFKSKKHE